MSFSLEHRVLRGEDSGSAIGYFFGLWSDDAVKEATERFRSAAQSIARSVSLVAGGKPGKDTDEWRALQEELRRLMEIDIGGPEGEPETDKTEQPESPPSKPPADESTKVSRSAEKTWPVIVGIDALCSDWGSRLFSACAQAFFETLERLKRKNDAMQRRLKNAVLLLIEADAQSHPAIQLSLSFAAIEALACDDNTTGIVDQLARNVATLLQPEPLDRKDTIEFVRELYKRRSKALHGVSLETEGEAKQVRRLAAAVLHAVVEWQGYQKRMVDSRERKQFFDELKPAEIAGKRMVGVPVDLARFVQRP